MLIHTFADGTVPMMPKLPAPTPPATVHGALEADCDVRALVTVQVAMTRDMLAMALDLAAGAAGESPGSWSVQYIRESVEMELVCHGAVELQRDAHLMVSALDDESVREQVQATYRAIDRAYPHLAESEQTSVAGPAVAAPVLVRSDVPSKPLAWIDPSPHVADEYGHVWTRDLDEVGIVHCLLCCEVELGERGATEPCGYAELLSVINEHRAQWIAEHRVEVQS